MDAIAQLFAPLVSKKRFRQSAHSKNSELIALQSGMYLSGLSQGAGAAGPGGNGLPPPPPGDAEKRASVTRGTAQPPGTRCIYPCLASVYL